MFANKGSKFIVEHFHATTSSIDKMRYQYLPPTSSSIHAAPPLGLGSFTRKATSKRTPFSDRMIPMIVMA